MPPQQQNSSYAARLGARVAQANVEYRDKPIDTGNRRLPGGIKSGIAKLSSMYTKLQEKEEGGKTPKGETFFRASATVILPVEHNGVRTAGMITQQIIPLCDIPAKKGEGYESKAVSFNENWNNFRSLFVLLGIKEPVGPQYDITGDPVRDQAAGMAIEAYYNAAMKALTDPQRPGGPVYIEFSTRGWKSPKRANETEEQFRNREEMVFETWHGLADPKKLQQCSPIEVANEIPSSPPSNGHAAPPAPFEEPPRGQVVMPDSTPEPETVEDLADTVAALVETALSDPDGATEEGAAASARLEELAWANGWTKEQTKNATDWAMVGDMAIDPPAKGMAQQVNLPTLPTVGSRWKFAKRTKEGAKLKNSKGEDLPPQEVEVVTVNADDKTCTVKSVKDGKDVTDFRSKKPINIKWEWLE